MSIVSKNKFVGQDNSEALDDALAGREPQSFVVRCAVVVVVVLVVRVEEAQRNNAASMTPTAVANVICKPHRRKKAQD